MGADTVQPDISTHALTEGDEDIFEELTAQDISTHALTEGDLLLHQCFSEESHFNSRPHGGRPGSALLRFHYPYFNSRPHGGRHAAEALPRRKDISTHALTEGDNMPPLSALLFCISTHALTEGDSVLGASMYSLEISTHALTEGDCKFRQIFLLNRGYAYSISLYFLPHFISLLPQILSFQQKPFKFQVRIFLLFSVHLAFALQNQCVHHVKSRFCTNMFYFVFVLFTQIVKSQTISLFIYDFF